MSESDLESAIERALTRMLAGGRIPLLSEAAATPPDDVKTEAIKLPNDAPVAGTDQTAAVKNTSPEHPETESKKDPTRRMKNRMAGRDVLKASESFGDT